ncbi:hypothetical protein EVAR_100893_1 [Eumeta japonica]|uniref:Uncharacterized protein n=1 Tax=Eumeta variegata TaxID=151549 RepID=A0A4C2A4C7_EUMVA|nr:hypothetical protein EVAR_100893_1 [Eumeta japonica]
MGHLRPRDGYSSYVALLFDQNPMSYYVGPQAEFYDPVPSVHLTFQYHKNHLDGSQVGAGIGQPLIPIGIPQSMFLLGLSRRSVAIPVKTLPPRHVYVDARALASVCQVGDPATSHKITDKPLITRMAITVCGFLRKLSVFGVRVSAIRARILIKPIIPYSLV